MLDADMLAVIAAQRLCFAATVTPDGKPNLSPKGTVRALDERHIFFCDIASPGTRENLRANPWMELNIVDQASRRGYRFFGRATTHTDDEIYRRATAQVAREEGVEYPVASVVLLEVERALPVVSPGYAHVATEAEMRDAWKKKRVTLDAEFEAHLRRRAAQ